MIYHIIWSIYERIGVHIMNHMMWIIKYGSYKNMILIKVFKTSDDSLIGPIQIQFKSDKTTSSSTDID